MNRALNQIPKRAEKREGAQLHETFVDSGIADYAPAPEASQSTPHIRSTLRTSGHSRMAFLS
jgi:hypothetical protein